MTHLFYAMVEESLLQLESPLYIISQRWVKREGLDNSGRNHNKKPTVKYR